MKLDSKGISALSLLLAALLGLLLAGCAPRIYTEQDDQASFAGYHSYAWVAPTPGKSVKDPILDSQILEGRVHRAVTAEFKDRGFEEVAADANPDFVVTYHTTNKEKIESTGPSFSFGFVDAFPRGFGAVAVPVGGDVQSREEGTLMLDVIDGKSKRLVWRGWTKGWVSQDSYTDDAVKSAVQQILAKFPPH